MLSLRSVTDCEPFHHFSAARMSAIPIVPDIAHSCVLRVRSLDKSFVRGSTVSPFRTDALVDVDLDLQNGEVVGVVGSAGAGKSTLLQCAAGILRRDRGFIDWFGEPFAGGGCVPDLAYVSPMPVYYPFLTVRDVLEYGIAKDDVPLSRRNEAISSALACLELDQLSSAYVCDLPRETIKRLAVAEALSAERRVIFLDTASSDIAGSCEPIVLRALEQQAASGRAVVIAVRSIGIIAPVASRIMLLEKGRNAGMFSNEQHVGRPIANAPFAAIVKRDRFVAERLH